jgi:anthranilate phosphoribosyltransferase
MVSFEELGGWPGVLTRVLSRRGLDEQEASLAFNEILEGNASEIQIAAFVAGLRAKGETVEEISGFVASMRAHAAVVSVPPDALDTCGTGGDRSGTINVSTAAAFVLAASGVPVCKHGGRAASSLAGSADVLEELGAVIDLGPKGVAYCLEQTGIGFCFAQRFHPAMRYAASVRRALGVATIFNFLGPLANPGRVKRQVLGVADPSMAEKMLAVLEAQGAVHAMIVYGHDGLDELSTVTTSSIFESFVDSSGTRHRRAFEVDPMFYGLERADPGSLLGGDARENAARLRSILSGEKSHQRDLVALNAAAGFVVGGRTDEIGDGLALAEEILVSGKAIEALDRFIIASKDAPGEH